MKERFRITHAQQARILLTELSADVRNTLVGLNEDELNNFFERKRTKTGKPSGLIKQIHTILQRGWQQSDALTRKEINNES